MPLTQPHSTQTESTEESGTQAHASSGLYFSKDAIGQNILPLPVSEAVLTLQQTHKVLHRAEHIFLDVPLQEFCLRVLFFLTSAAWD